MKHTRNAMHFELLMAALDVFPVKPLVITVAGTNGKGTTVSYLESILTQAGICNASFTSPHLFRFNERIKINQKPVSDALINDVAVTVQRAIQKVGTVQCAVQKVGTVQCAVQTVQRAVQTHRAIQKKQQTSTPTISYFEHAFLTALIIFKQAKPEVIILEVGIGGRHDVVNCIDADIAVITAIDIDHTETLGNDRETIGYDKAGIMRPNKPVVVSDLNPPKSLLDYAIKIKATLIPAGKMSLDTLPKDTFPAGIPKQNIIGVLLVVDLLKKQFKITDQHMRDGFKFVKLQGRCQLICYQNRKILIDVAHNPAATKHLADYIQTLNIKGKIHAIVGMMKDKDIRGSLANMIPVIDQWHVMTLSSERSASLEQLKAALQKNDDSKSLKVILQNTNKDDLIVIFGSFTLVGDIFRPS